MTISGPSANALEKIRAWQWDSIVEKHEGPEDWEHILDHGSAEFLTISGCSVLLPIHRDRHPNITALRSIVSEDGNSLTIFLKDTTHYPSPEDELFWTGRMAVCDRMPGEDFFIAIVYHEWFILTTRRKPFRKDGQGREEGGGTPPLHRVEQSRCGPVLTS